MCASLGRAFLLPNPVRTLSDLAFEVSSGGSLVRPVFDRRFRVAYGPLGVPFEFLSRPFFLELVRSDYRADALLNLANRLIRKSARLVRRNGGTIFFSLRLTARVSYDKSETSS
jgi:hypothetical protein